MYNEDGSPSPKLERTVTAVVVIFVLAVALLLSVYIVPAGSVGVVTRFGAVNRVAEPGIGMKIPLAEGVHKMTVRTQLDKVDASSASLNLQVVTAVIAVNYHLDGKYATEVYQQVGTKYQEIVVAPAIQNAFKATTAMFTAENLIGKRAEVAKTAETKLQEELANYHIVVENFNIVNFDFSAEYNSSIEAKQVMEQNVKTAELELSKARINAQQKVVEAQAQADAQKALKDTGALTPQYLQYLFLTKWNGILPQVTGGATPVFDVQNYLGQTTP